MAKPQQSAPPKIALSFENELLALHQKPSKKLSSAEKATEKHQLEFEAAAWRRHLSGIAMQERGFTARETPPPPPVEKVVISCKTIVSNVRTFYFQPSEKKKNSEEDRQVLKVLISFYTIES